MRSQTTYLYFLSMVLCILIEVFIQRVEKVIGLGIIGAIFLCLALWHDFYIELKNERKDYKKL